MATRAGTSTRARATPQRRTALQGKTPDALALLKADHRRVEELFEQFEAARRGDRKERIVSSICEELTLHAQLEEDEFYPLVRETLPKDEHLVDEAEVEHASLKSLIAQLEGESAESELYDAKVTVLKEYVSHHVKEEEKQIFPRLKKSALDTIALGKTLLAAKAKLKTQRVH